MPAHTDIKRKRHSLKRESDSSMHIASTTAKHYSQPSMTSAPQPSRQPIFHPEFIEDYEYWKKNDPKIADKIRELVKDSLQDPFNGKSKPKPLKHIGSNIWSRRINQKDRFVYLVKNNSIDFIQARHHY